MLGGMAIGLSLITQGQSPSGYDTGTSEHLADRQTSRYGWHLQFRVKGAAWNWPSLLLNAESRTKPSVGALIILDRKRSMNDPSGFESTGFVARIEAYDGKNQMRVRRYVEGTLGGILEWGGWSDQLWTLNLIPTRPGYAKFGWETGSYRILGYLVEKRP